MKKCRKCGVEKELSCYYKHKQMLDGYLNICKDCTKERVGVHRKNNIDSIRAYDRKRGLLDHRLEANRIRSRNPTDKQKNKKYLYTKKYREENKIKYACHILVANALKTKKLVKPIECSECSGKDRIIHGHHEDYMKPLDVIWLCNKCHKKRHRKYEDL